MFKKIITIILATFYLALQISSISSAEPIGLGLLKAVISTPEAVEIQKSTIFDASQSFLPDPSKEITYSWEFGDGNKNEGVEVLHNYKTPGKYTITLTITDGKETSTVTSEVFAYSKSVILITDHKEAQERIELLKKYGEEKGVYLKIIDSFGSSTEFISEEVLTKKMNQAAEEIKKSAQIIAWTKENAGLNALSRYLQSNQKRLSAKSLVQKNIVVIENDIDINSNRIQRQFELIQPKNIIVTQEFAINFLLNTKTDQDFIRALEEGGYEYIIINEKSGKLTPLNFMSYLFNILITSGVPDNTIALLLLLPIIATVVAFMKQVVGVTTFGIYTPSIITLSFLVIGMYAGLLTLTAAITVGALSRPVLKRIRTLFVPRMAVVITVVSLTLFLILIASNYLGLFDAQFLSIAIFPMLILSTLVEKFVSVRTDKGLTSAISLMAATVLVSIIAYFIVGGEINLGFAIIKFSFIKNLIMSYPELVLLLIVINILLGRWSGLRILERIRFREVLRHIEE
ncbi:PKD domain-containing protein [Candidatus Peregrinibacteria bacterium]|nr:PKD domain-containing protein [Candidatus Peregrinibacteria bacterium]